MPQVLRLIQPKSTSLSGDACYSVEQIQRLAKEHALVVVVMEDGRNVKGHMLGLRDGMTHLYLEVQGEDVKVGLYWRAVGIYRVSRQ